MPTSTRSSSYVSSYSLSSSAQVSGISRGGCFGYSGMRSSSGWCQSSIWWVWYPSRWSLRYGVSSSKKRKYKFFAMISSWLEGMILQNDDYLKRLIMRTKNSTIAITTRIWINHPNVYEDTSPSTQSTRRIMAIVSIIGKNKIPKYKHSPKLWNELIL